MSEPTIQVITTKAKDPKRDETGKRLAQISKEFRERKMREKVQAEMRTEYSSASWYGYLSGAAGLILAGLSVYYARAQHQRESQGTTEPLKPDTVTIVSPTKQDNFG